MESSGQFFNESSSNDTSTEGVPLYLTYLLMVTTLILAIIVITPAVTIINVIRETWQLHTKYFFFVAHLLAIEVTSAIATSVMIYLMIILYLLDLNSDSAGIALKWLVIAPAVLVYLMSILSPIPVAVERMITIAFPFRHRSIMTTKTVATMLTVMWMLSAILTIIIIITVPVDIVWPLGLIHFHQTFYAVIAISYLTSIICTVAANGFLQYKIAVSNKKAKENQRLGNEVEVKKFKKLSQEIRAQAKATITIFLVGGIDVIANILQVVAYAVTETLIGSNKKMYILIFSFQLMGTSFLLFRILMYGLYMKKIRNRLPNWMVCYRQWIARHNRVGILRQQPQVTINDATERL